MAGASVGRCTEALSSYALDLRYEDVPAEVRQHVQRMLLNMLAAVTWGARTAGGHQVEQVLTQLGGPDEAAVFGSHRRMPAVYAAATHAARAFATMSDDTHAQAQIHSGHATIPPALAMCELLGLTGTEFVTSVVAANEVAIRIAYAAGPGQSGQYNTFRAGFWSEVKCTFAAAVAAGRLLRLSPTQMGHAIGIAASSSSGLLATGYGLPPQETRCGTAMAWDAAKAVMLGMQAAQLARAGMTVAPQPLEGRQGWVHTYTRGHGDIEALIEGLGERFETLRVALKPHCMSHTSFGLVEAVSALVQREDIEAGEVDRVTIVGPSYLPDYLWRTTITSFEDAVCSTPFAVAMGILEPDSLTLPDRVWARVSDPQMRALLSRFAFALDDSITVNAGPLAGAVEITVRDGRQYRAEAATVTNGMYPQKPMPDGDLERKFLRGADGLIAPEAARAVVDAVQDLASADVPSLCRLLAAPDDATPYPVWT
jgi:aconitate decarboxylase